MTKGVFYAVIGGIVIVVIGATYAYTQRPNRAVSNAVQKLSQAETQRFEATIALDNPAATQQLLQDAGKLTLALSGSFKRNEAERDSLVSDIIVNAQTEGVTLELAGELRLIGDKAYLLVKKSPTAIPLLAALKDKWVELPRGEVQTGAAPESEAPLFTQVARAEREQVGEVSARKYETVATQQAVVGFMNELAQLLGTRLTDQQIGTIQSNLASLEELPITLWITPASHELVQIETRLGDTGTQYQIKLSDRNQAVEHAVPEGAKPIGEILQQQ